MTTTAMPAPIETPRARVDATLGMVIFIGSWTMAFLTLFLTFFILRQRQDVWPPEGVVLPSFSRACLATSVLLMSSAALHAAVVRLKQGRAFVGMWTAGLLLGVGFAALQSWLWLDLWNAGRLPGSGTYESLFYGLTWIHAAHVVCGLLGLLFVLPCALRGTIGAHRQTLARNVAIFWHFVDVVWIVLFVSFFLT